MTTILDRVRQSFTRKQTEAAETYADVVRKLATDEPVTEAAIVAALEATNKTPDELQTDVDNQRERIRLGDEVTRYQKLMDDVVIARREQTKLIADRDREIQAINERYQPQIDECDSRIRGGEAARFQRDRAQSALSLIVRVN